MDKSVLLDLTKSDGTHIIVDKDFNIIEKAMSAGSQTGRELDGIPTSGAALKKESLDDKLKVLVEKEEAIKVIAENEDKLSEEGKKKVKKAIEDFLNSK
jgi:hypothetical protein